MPKQEKLKIPKAESEERPELQEMSDELKRTAENIDNEASHQEQGKEIEREKIIEESQEQRKGLLANILTSEIISNGLDFIPFAGSGKMLVESIVGKTLTGREITGRYRVIHGAIGASSLLLDFTGIGEIADEIEKAAFKIEEGGLAKTAELFSKTSQFLKEHPEETAQVEKLARKHIERIKKEHKQAA